MIDLIEGKVTEEEKKHMRKYLLNIMRRADRPYIGEDKNQGQLNNNSSISIQENKTNTKANFKRCAYVFT
ncbi:MAG: hypothetical protein WCC17_03485 [Candidatus Nitrosopolaris sp.]